MTSRRVAVVLASINPGPSLENSLTCFLREVKACGELILVDASTDGSSELAARRFPAIRVVHRENALAPELWRDGLRATDAELVAFSTTQMVPRKGWLRELLAAWEGSETCGVGGAIEPGQSLGPVDRAIYLHRHLRYASGHPLPKRPSGENALYVRNRLLDVEASWSEGFWETEVQRRIEEQGGAWSSAPRSIVTYQGRTRLMSIIGQRVAHARRFGANRARPWAPWRCLLQSTAAPLVPALLLARAGRALIDRRMPIGPWIASVPSFLAIASAWAYGEVIGTIWGHRRSRAWITRKNRWEPWSSGPDSSEPNEPPRSVTHAECR